MWIGDCALEALSGWLPDAIAVDVAFHKPLLLPSTVELATARTDDGWQFAVRGKGAEHLVGVVRRS